MTTIKTYHHGDLRVALLTAARAKLESEGYEALSLRALARDIGVASSAPYAHFNSREALLRALIDQGGDQLGVLFRAIADGPASAPEKLAMAGHAYLTFARTNPELLRLIFVAPVRVESGSPAAMRTIDLFERLVAGVMHKDAIARVRDIAVGCWSVLHGFTMLRLHNRLGPDLNTPAIAERIVDAAVRIAQTA